MCGIVGYVGQKQALEIIVAGLRRLEYRGYDSAGVAVISDGTLEVRKKAGKLANLETLLGSDPMPDSTTGIGHTRWATHGGPTDSNAHPHASQDRRVAVIHNGIIENFAELRDELTAAGVLAGLRDRYRGGRPPARRGAPARRRRPDGGDARSAAGSRAPSPCWRSTARAAGPRRRCARNSPLSSASEWGRTSSASDVAAFVDHTREALELGQDQVVTITPTSVEITDFAGAPAQRSTVHGRLDTSAAQKGGYPYFMRKEIAEQPKPVAGHPSRADQQGPRRLQLDEIHIHDDILRSSRMGVVIACGTAVQRGLVAKYAIEHWTRLPVEVELASEFRYRDPMVGPDTLAIAVRQSGETIDTLKRPSAGEGSGGQDARDLNTVGSTRPASRTGSSTRTRGRRSGSPRPRRSHADHRRVPRGPASFGAGDGDLSTADRSPRLRRRADADLPARSPS